MLQAGLGVTNLTKPNTIAYLEYDSINVVANKPSSPNNII